MRCRKILISSLLPRSQREALSYSQISRAIGLSARQIRAAIRYERRQGIPIMTSHEHGNSGVWLWDGQDQEEFNRCQKRLVRTGMDIVETARLMKEGLANGFEGVD